MTKKFTGWHMTTILVAFFAVIIAVNVGMARLASSTFGGALAENGYVASQNYNRWIREARTQEKLGWSIATSTNGGKLVIATDFAPDRLEVRLNHPLGRSEKRTMEMVNAGDGKFISKRSLPQGRWKIIVTAIRGGDRASFVEEVRR